MLAACGIARREAQRADRDFSSVPACHCASPSRSGQLAMAFEWAPDEAQAMAHLHGRLLGLCSPTIRATCSQTAWRRSALIPASGWPAGRSIWRCQVIRNARPIGADHVSAARAVFRRVSSVSCTAATKAARCRASASDPRAEATRETGPTPGRWSPPAVCSTGRWACSNAQ